LNLKENQQIKEIIEHLRKGMLEFIEDDDYYTPKDVEACIQILTVVLNRGVLHENKNNRYKNIFYSKFIFINRL
jgi:hypothetical protein